MGRQSANLEDLVCLNREIAALVKAGVPIEIGLRGLAGAGATGFERLAERLADRLRNGSSLTDAIREEGPAISPTYASVIEAGLTSGRLPEALESLAASGQVLQETRRRIALAAIYPIICLIVAYVLLCQWVFFIVPRLLSVLDLIETQPSVKVLHFVDQYRDYITFVVPLSILAVFVVVFLLRRGFTMPLWQSLTSFRWIIGGSLNWAQFTELLAIQVEQKCPLPAAFELAATSTSDGRLQQQATRIREQLDGGMSLADSLQSATLIPPLVRWMLAAGERQGTLAGTLRQLSQMFRRQALYRSEIVKVWMPVVMTIGLTGFVGLTYGLGFIIPFRDFLEGLTRE